MQKEQKDYQYRFALDDEINWRKYLQQNGFVVFKNVINQKQSQQHLGQLWDLMQDLSFGKLDRNKQQTLCKSSNYPGNVAGGMIQYIGHTKVQWKLRLKSKKVFEKLWNCEDLVSSFDGFCFMNGKRKYKSRPNNSFLHVDQASSNKKFWCYQGLINLVDNDQQSGGLVVSKKSHLFFNQYFKQYQNQFNWYQVPHEDRQIYPLSNIVKVCAKAGDFLVWEGRTFHCNTVPTNNNLRVCEYVCMIPRKDVSQDIQKYRQQAIQKRRTSTHHPGEYFNIFPKYPEYVKNQKSIRNKIDQINKQYDLKQMKQIL